MRCYKPISFRQFADFCAPFQCELYGCDKHNKVVTVKRVGYSEGVSMCKASVCPLWKEHSHTNLTVVNVTATNTARLKLPKIDCVIKL